MKTIEITLNRSISRYSIEIGSNILNNIGLLLKTKLGLKDTALPKIFLISHLNLNTLYGHSIVKSLKDMGFQVHVECVNIGESVKNWATAEKLLNKMIEQELSRSSIVLALGGGVVGDMAGFVSSVYQRGIRFVQIPTSLLSMVDASVGGKVAVNLGLVGKNLIGSFHQPSLVMADLNTLKSLPEAEWKAGLGEVLKYAFLKEDRGAFYNWLVENKTHILMRDNPDLIEYIVSESIRTKSQFVARDENETSGIRILLNLGHTFGHSLEAASRYRLAHGEAISIGMCLSARLALKLSKTSQAVSDQIVNLVKTFGLPHQIDKKHGFTPSDLMRHFKYDKKNEGEIVRFIVPAGSVIGHCEVVQNVSEQVLKEVFEEAIH